MAQFDPRAKTIPAIARRLRALREAMGKSPAEMCRLTGIKANTWSNWEGLRGRPDLDSAIAIAANTQATLDFIYLGIVDTLPHRFAEDIRKKLIHTIDPATEKRRRGRPKKTGISQKEIA